MHATEPGAAKAQACTPQAARPRSIWRLIEPSRFGVYNKPRYWRGRIGPPCNATLNVLTYYSSGNMGGRPEPIVITSQGNLREAQRRYRFSRRVSNLFAI